jgi:hypothetical protein
MRGQFRFQHAGRSEIAAATAGATFGAAQQRIDKCSGYCHSLPRESRGTFDKINAQTI